VEALFPLKKIKANLDRNSNFHIKSGIDSEIFEDSLEF
jgi:hypothetical protein